MLGGCWVEDEVEAVGMWAGMACEARTSDGAELRGVGGWTTAIVREVGRGREEVSVSVSQLVQVAGSGESRVQERLRQMR